MKSKHYLVTFAVAGLLLTTCSTVGMAQSTDAGYPLHGWNNYFLDPDNTAYLVDIDIARTTEPNDEFAGRKGCGSLTVTNGKTAKTLYQGQLNYAGKGMNNDGTPNGVYYFDIRSKDGRTAKIGLKKSTDTLSVVSLTGQIVNSVAFQKELFLQIPINGSWVPIGAEAQTEKELLDELRDALANDDKEQLSVRAAGFGDVKQYITAHAGLDPSKPKYVKVKGTGNVNIRATGNTTAAKIGSLQPGKTMLVTDEYDGWCQVKMDDGKNGWVSLSVVTLTNTGSSTSTASSSTATFTLENGTLGPLRIGQSVASLPKSVKGLYDSYKYTKELIESDMEDPWTQELCHFYKGGKEIFQAGASEKKIASFTLLKGSEFIKTPEGYHVGYNARQLFRKKPMEWETYYEGEVFATEGRYTYRISSDDLIGQDTPSKETHIKANAGISSITYY